MGFFAFLAIAVPWYMGAAALLYISRPVSEGGQMSAIGLGGMLGLFTVAFLAQLAMLFGNAPPNALILVFCITTSIVFSIGLAARNELPAISISSLFITGIGLAIVSVSMWLNFKMPISGWDVLGHWGSTAFTLFESIDSSALSSATGKRHPITLPLLHQYGMWVASVSGISFGSALAWVFFPVSGLLLTLGMALQSGFHAFLGLVIFLTTVFTPLAENHVGLAGYADMPQGVINLCLVSVLVALRKSLTAENLALAVLFTFVAYSLRNSSPLFVLLAWGSFALTYITIRMLWIPILLALLLTVLIGHILLEGIDIVLFEQVIRFVPNKMKLIVFGKKLIFVEPDLWTVLLNTWSAFFLNSSFGMSFVSVIVLSLALMTKRQSANAQSWIGAIFFLFGLLLLALFQTTEYGAKFSAPRSDTGLSRFSLSIFPVLAVFYVYALRFFYFGNNQAGRDRQPHSS